ncbi:alanine racemase [Prochlorococcus sp. MIT 1223]|uniref:alanine racemase n=1 Tax=Prochlorococcus sp. MIT 1223 TaxID=3096217 RepID=UPI002A752A85|nr:alanine racemase [Prochlorococcus sp. MIT 1223]
MNPNSFVNLTNQYMSSTDFDPCQRAWIEINSSAIEANTQLIKEFVGPKCSLMAVVKADGYGHGAETVARAALLGGANYLGVATLKEGIDLRKAGLKCPILILGNLVSKNELKASLLWGLTVTLSSIREALICQDIAEDCKKNFNVHIKVDTGMSRLGCDLQDALSFCTEIESLDNIHLEGVYSHLASADSDFDSKGDSVTSSQKNKFDTLINSLSSKNDSLCFHLANSAGTLCNNSLHYNMVRVGLALYGQNPLPKAKSDLALEPAMSVKARVSLLRTVPKGTGVSYGHKFKTNRESRLAVVGIGYADGVSRALSGKISVMYNGKLIPQIGSITMDQLVLDITDYSDLKVGKIVTLLGKDGSNSVDAQLWSEMIGSIPWEILCSFKNRLPRVVV